MPISRAQKAELIATYKQQIEASQAVVMAGYSGLSVGQMQQLRSGLRENGASFLVAKKSLMSLALIQAGLPVPEAAMDGPVGFAFLGEDLSAGAKALKDFVKEAGGLFTIQGGVLGDSVLDPAGAIALADLPSRDVQLAQLIAAVSAPMTSIVSLISAPHRDLIGLLQARIDDQGGDTAEAAAA